MDELSVSEIDMIDEFAGLFDDEPKTDPIMNEQGEEGVVEAPETEPEEEVVEIDMDAFVPVQIGEESIEVTLEELSRSYIREQDYTHKVGLLTTKAAEILEMEKQALVGLELAKLECDIILEDAASIDMSTLSPEEFKDMSLKKARLKEKAAAIKSKMDAMKPRHDEIEANVKMTKAREAFDHLQREVPGFGVEMYNSALSHAVNVLGVDAEFAKNCTDAGIIKALISANESYVSPARLKKTRMPVKTAKVAAPVTKTKNYSREEDLLALGESLF